MAHPVNPRRPRGGRIDADKYAAGYQAGRGAKPPSGCRLWLLVMPLRLATDGDWSGPGRPTGHCRRIALAVTLPALLVLFPLLLPAAAFAAVALWATRDHAGWPLGQRGRQLAGSEAWHPARGDDEPPTDAELELIRQRRHQPVHTNADDPKET